MIPYNLSLSQDDERAIAIPAIGKSFSISARKNDKNITLSATLAVSTGRVTFPSSYSKGCEIQISSTPDQARIKINEELFYSETNTALVMEPGKIKVSLEKEGYEKWEKEKETKKGETWVIHADLKKIK